MRPKAAFLALAGLAGAAHVARAEPDWVRVDRVIAVVNADVVLESELRRRMAAAEADLARLKPADRGRERIELSRKILDGLIDQRIEMQAAAQVGVGVTGPEVDEAIAQIEQMNHMDRAALEKAVADKGYSMADYRQEVGRQILQLKIANVVLRPRIQPTEDQIKAAYDAAKKADPKGVADYATVHDAVAKKLMDEALPEAHERWIADLRSQSYIDVREQR